jgi:uncharacterized UBP type Zn finger protein
VEPAVKVDVLAQLEDMGFGHARALRALHFSGNSSLEGAINWLEEHAEDADLDQPLLIPKSEVCSCASQIDALGSNTDSLLYDLSPCVSKYDLSKVDSSLDINRRCMLLMFWVPIETLGAHRALYGQSACALDLHHVATSIASRGN